VVGGWRDGCHFVLPTDVSAQRQSTRNQHFFDVVLLQIDHAGALVTGVGHQVELVHLFLLQEGAANVPAHAHGAGLIGDPQAVQDFQCAFGIAHGPRTHRDGFVVVQNQHIQALQAGVDGRRQTHRTGTNDDQGPALRRRGHQVGWRLVGINWIGICTHAWSPAMRKAPLGARARNLL
jgi:hypothetical protein